MDYITFVSNSKEFVRGNELKKCFDFIASHIDKKSDAYNDLITIEASYNSLNKSKIRGTLSHEQISISLSNIIDRLLIFIDCFEKSSFRKTSSKTRKSNDLSYEQVIDIKNGLDLNDLELTLEEYQAEYSNNLIAFKNMVTLIIDIFTTKGEILEKGYKNYKKFQNAPKQNPIVLKKITNSFAKNIEIYAENLCELSVNSGISLKKVITSLIFLNESYYKNGIKFSKENITDVVEDVQKTISMYKKMRFLLKKETVDLGNELTYENNTPQELLLSLKKAEDAQNNYISFINEFIVQMYYFEDAFETLSIKMKLL